MINRRKQFEYLVSNLKDIPKENLNKEKNSVKDHHIIKEFILRAYLACWVIQMVFHILMDTIIYFTNGFR